MEQRYVSMIQISSIKAFISDVIFKGAGVYLRVCSVTTFKRLEDASI